jgi:hydroxybutyrate-dimer hydrolase
MRTRLAAACIVLSAPIARAEGTAPPWLHLGAHTVYDGVTDDLVTGGLGADAMLGKRPGYADPLHPTAAELRRAALFQTGGAGQGLGRLFGPDVDELSGQKIPGQGKVAGDEYLAYADDGEGQTECCDAAAGSREPLSRPALSDRDPSQRLVESAPRRCRLRLRGLRRGRAVVYTDKGHGDGFDILETDSVNLLDGRQVPAAEAGRNAHFRADLEDAARVKFLAEWPHRIAFKAAHSKQNPEKDWGEDLLKAIRFAFYQLGQRDPKFTRDNTLVIATGSSNGGGAVLYAAERDVSTGAHLIDGVVAREPQVQLKPDDRVVVARGSTERRGGGRALLDYFTFGNLYQPCAALAVPDIPLRDFVASDGTATKYANDHGRFGVRDRLCGYSFAEVDKDGRPIAVPPAEQAQNFAIAPGGAPAGSIDVINDKDPTGPRRSWLSESKTTGRQDYDLDGAICLRGLITGQSPEAKLVQAGIAEFLATGRPDGKPTIIVHGRNDDRVPVSFSSRPYVGLNDLEDGARSQLSYLEVTNAEHFGTDLPGFDTRMVPLTLYHLRALDLMWDHLTEGAPLPESQVVQTMPRGGEAGHAPQSTPPTFRRSPLSPAPKTRPVRRTDA